MGGDLIRTVQWVGNTKILGEENYVPDWHSNNAKKLNDIAPCDDAGMRRIMAEAQIENLKNGGVAVGTYSVFKYAPRLLKSQTPRPDTSVLAAIEGEAELPAIGHAEGLLKTMQIRQAGEAAGDVISKRKNIAYAEVDLTAFQGELRAISGQSARSGFVTPSPFRIFHTKEAGGFFRGYDAEAHLLEDIGKRLSPDSFGTIRLFSEFPVCGSCGGVIGQFIKRHP